MKKEDKILRILHVVAAMNRAGTESLLMNLFRNVDRDKIQFDFAVCTSEKCDYEDEIIKLGGRVIRYPRYSGINHLQYVAWWKKFFNEHKEYRIVHGHIGSTASIYLSIARRYGIYTIAHSHNFGAGMSFRNIIYKIYSYRTRFIADYFFGCSKAALIERYGKTVADDRNKSRVLPNAINSENFSYNAITREKIRNELSIHKETFVIGTVGRITKQKNPFGILDIIETYRKCADSDFIFLWVGTGDLETSVKEEIHNRNLENSIRMLGVRDDVNDVMQAMDVFIFPSLWEGLGIVAIEAQAAGLQTLCSDRLPDEVNITSLCKFIPPEDVKQWTQAISKAKGHKRKDMSKEIKSAKYDIKDISKELEQFYLSRKIEKAKK